VDGHVIASTVVSSSMEAARALLSSPARIAAVDGRGAEVVSRPQDGCILSDVVAPSVMGDIIYSSMSCPAEGGFAGSLVSSEKLRQMEARWTLRLDGDLLHVQYDLFVVPRISVPQRLVASLSKRAVRRLVEAIGDELEREGAAARAARAD